MIEYNAPRDADDKWTRIDDIDIARVVRFNPDAFEKGYKLRIGSTIYNKSTPELEKELKKEKIWARLQTTGDRQWPI